MPGGTGGGGGRSLTNRDLNPLLRVLGAIAVVGAVYCGCNVFDAYKISARMCDSTVGTILGVAVPTGTRAANHKSIKTYAASVSYEFTVGGGKSRGQRYWPSSPAHPDEPRWVDSESEARALAGVRPGQQVTIFYDPSAPQLRSTLEDPQALGSLVMGLMLPLCFGLPGLFLLRSPERVTDRLWAAFRDFQPS